MIPMADLTNLELLDLGWACGEFSLVSNFNHEIYILYYLS